MTQSGSTGSGGGGAGWTKAPSQPAQPGPAGFVYADVPNRAIAYIIDAIIIGIIDFIVFIILSVIGNSFLTSILVAVVGLAISFGYFWYTWTKNRGTVGMKALGMQVGNAGDGKTLTNDQAIRRFIALFAPFVLAQAFTPIGIIGSLIGLLAFGWLIYLLYTTAKSPTKQGFHDVFANTMVVKATRSVA